MDFQVARRREGDIATSLSHFAMSLYDMWGSRWCDITTSHDIATVSPTTCQGCWCDIATSHDIAPAPPTTFQ